MADAPLSSLGRYFSPGQNTSWIHSFVALVLLPCACESLDPDPMGFPYSPEIAGQPGSALLGYFPFWSILQGIKHLLMIYWMEVTFLSTQGKAMSASLFLEFNGCLAKIK